MCFWGRKPLAISTEIYMNCDFWRNIWQYSQRKTYTCIVNFWRNIWQYSHRKTYTCIVIFSRKPLATFTKEQMYMYCEFFKKTFGNTHRGIVCVCVVKNSYFFNYVLLQIQMDMTVSGITICEYLFYKINGLGHAGKWLQYYNR